MPKIAFQHSGKSVDADEGEWMFEVAERAESGIPFACKAGAGCGCFSGCATSRTCSTPTCSGA